MAAINDITGDLIQTRSGLSEEGKANWDKIFPPKKKERYVPPPLNLDGAVATPDQSMESTKNESGIRTKRSTKRSSNP